MPEESRHNPIDSNSRAKLCGYAIKHQFSQEKENCYLYSRSFIQDLRDNYLTKQQIMKRFKIGKSRFYVWKKSRGIEPLVIGQVSLVKKDIVFAEIKKCS